MVAGGNVIKEMKSSRHRLRGRFVCFVAVHFVLFFRAILIYLFILLSVSSQEMMRFKPSLNWLLEGPRKELGRRYASDIMFVWSGVGTSGNGMDMNFVVGYVNGPCA